MGAKDNYCQSLNQDPSSFEVHLPGQVLFPPTRPAPHKSDLSDVEEAAPAEAKHEHSAGSDLEEQRFEGQPNSTRPPGAVNFSWSAIVSKGVSVTVPASGVASSQEDEDDGFTVVTAKLNARPRITCRLE